jgi:Flp pilus assembly pilin Flp
VTQIFVMYYDKAMINDAGSTCVPQLTQPIAQVAAGRLLTRFVLRWRERVRSWHVVEDGQGMVEYAFILVMIALVVILTVILLGNSVKNIYCNISVDIGV